ncbi:MAG: hypothetical protein WKF96_22095, partial [Solirubrobacteraceae bacterium]
MRARRLAVALAFVAALVSPAAASASEKAIWGPVTLPNGDSAFPTYQRLGVDTLQFQLNWRAIAPERPADPSNPADPAYAWPQEVDSAVAQAGPAGINVALLVSGSPGWANGGQSALHAPNPADYATFMAAASRRYPTVRRWMVWGEPNRKDRFLPNETNGAVGPRAYAEILDAAYGSLKAVSKRNIVIGGMTWTGGDVKPATFMRLMRLPSGKPPRLDWFGHNPFPIRFPNLREIALAGGFRDISDLDAFSRQLRRTYGKRAKFWLSEFLVLSDRASNEFELFVSRAEQARWLAAAYRIADSLPSVAGLGWLSLLDQPQRQGSSNWGLLTDGGVRKPAYRAFRAARGERFRPAVEVARGVRARAISKRGLAVRVKPIRGGRVSVELRRGSRVVARVARGGRAGIRRTLRLRARRLPRGSYTCTVRASRG